MAKRRRAQLELVAARGRGLGEDLAGGGIEQFGKVAPLDSPGEGFRALPPGQLGLGRRFLIGEQVLGGGLDLFIEGDPLGRDDMAPAEDVRGEGGLEAALHLALADAGWAGRWVMADPFQS